MDIFFETKHLLARKLEPEDAVQLYENHAEEKVKRWFPNESYADLNEAKEAIHFFRECVDGNHLPFVLAVQLKETGELIGDTGVSIVDGQSEAVENGYEATENGYEAVKNRYEAVKNRYEAVENRYEVVENRCEAIEIGYLICEKYSGRGFATEVLNAMTEFSFARFGAAIIYGRVVHGNSASARVLEKAGYLFVDEKFGAEDDPYGNGMLVYKRERE